MFAARLTERRRPARRRASSASSTGIGGGLIRDLLLNQLPGRAAEQLVPAGRHRLPRSSACCSSACFSASTALIIVLDALTIGLFGAIGTTKALALGLPVVPAVFVGVLAAVGGSILRDLLLNLPIALMHVGSLYAVAALVGTLSLVVLVAFGVPTSSPPRSCASSLTFTVRVLAVLFHWTLPEQQAALSGSRAGPAQQRLTATRRRSCTQLRPHVTVRRSTTQLAIVRTRCGRRG